MVDIDWFGKTQRIEMVPAYCANCGLCNWYVPKDNTTFAFYLCNQCHEQYGEIAGHYAMPDEQFCQNVSNEMHEKFKRDLTDLEIFKLLEKGELGTSLELLVKESPYKVYKPS